MGEGGREGRSVEQSPVLCTDTVTLTFKLGSTPSAL